MTRRVVVTGVGLVSPLGIGTEANWEALCAGRSGIGPITHFDAAEFSARIAGEVKHFDPLQFVSKKDVKKMDVFIQYAIAASQFAMDDAGLSVTEDIATRVGVFIASGIGGFTTIEREHKALLEGGPRRISPFFIPASIINLAAGQVSIRFSAKGPNSATCTACSASAHAIGDAFEIIRRDDADVMIAGGSEAAITPMAVGGFAAMRALSTRNDDPDARQPPVRPASATASSWARAPASSSSRSSSSRSGAARSIYAELVGYGMSADAFHITAPSEDGDGGMRVMQKALTHAGIAPAQVDYINAHGTSTPFNDRLETLAIKRLFGEHARKLAISSTKSMTGHLLGAAGRSRGRHHRARDQAPAAFRRPSTTSARTPTCDLDYVPNHDARRPPSNTRSRTRSGSAAPTGRCCSSGLMSSSPLPAARCQQVEFIDTFVLQRAAASLVTLDRLPGEKRPETRGDNRDACCGPGLEAGSSAKPEAQL